MVDSMVSERRSDPKFQILPQRFFSRGRVIFVRVCKIPLLVNFLATCQLINSVHRSPPELCCVFILIVDTEKKNLGE